MAATPATPASESVTLATADGEALEGEVVVPSDPVAAAVITHPHPLNGGDMESTVPAALFRALPGHGIAALRFNFRGVGKSTGSYGDGVDERLDVEAAIAALADRVPDVALFVAGWSFGADVALRVVDERVAGWYLIAPPLAIVPLDEMAAASDPRPKCLAVPQHDEFRPPAAAHRVTADWTNTEVDVVAGTSHFLVGHADEVADRAARFILDAR